MNARRRSPAFLGGWVRHFLIVGGILGPAFSFGCPARADEPEATAGQPAVTRPTRLFFAGVDGWNTGASAHAGLLWSPAGLENEGFTLKLLSGAGAYRYHSGALGRTVSASETFDAVLPGWRFKSGTLEITAFAGLDLDARALSAEDPGSRLRGFHAGLRGGADLWYEPAQNTMLAVNAWATTIGSGYWTRAATGWRILDAAWIGPEVQALGDADYRQMRAGIHLTGLRTGGWEWSASVGAARDKDRRDGLYGRIGILTRR